MAVGAVRSPGYWKKEIKADQLVYQTSIVRGRALLSPAVTLPTAASVVIRRAGLEKEDGETLAPVCGIGARLAKTSVR